MLRKVKNILWPDVSMEVRTLITEENTRSVRSISAVVTILELIVLTLFVLSSEDPFGPKNIRSVVSVIICILVSGAVWTYLKGLEKSRKAAEEVRKEKNIALVVYFIVLANWGMVASMRHYVISEQMLTFFMVEMVCASFIAFHPLVGLVLMPGSFVEFFVFLYRADQAAKINVINYAAMALLCYVTVTIKYHRVVKQIESTLSIQKLNEQLHEVSMTDTLTGIGNRLAVRRQVDKVIGHEVGVMMCDVDMFKSFNDNNGHETGDKVLIQIADKLKKEFPAESCFRYGGDEFLIIASGMTGEEFQKRKENWLREVERINVPGVDGPVHCSCGVVFGKPRNADEMRYLIHGADGALYEEKRMHHLNMANESEGKDLQGAFA